MESQTIRTKPEHPRHAQGRLAGPMLIQPAIWTIYTHDGGDEDGTLTDYGGNQYPIAAGSPVTLPTPAGRVFMEIIGVGRWRLTFDPASSAANLVAVGLGCVATMAPDPGGAAGVMSVGVYTLSGEMLHVNGSFEIMPNPGR